MANKVKQTNALRPILSSAPSGLSGVIYFDSGLSKLRFYNGTSFVELADFGQLSSTSSGKGASLIGVEFTPLHFSAGSQDVEAYLAGIDTALGAVSSSTPLDTVFRIENAADNTKKIAFSASGISTGQTRTVTMPDFDVDLGNLTNSNISASAAIAYSKLALSGSIVNADVNASAAIAYSKLALSNSIVNADINSAAAIAYSKLALSNSIVNADINSSAAIAYSKLSLSNSIVNADISSSAAISRAKLAAGNAFRVLVNDVSGLASEQSAITAARALISDANGLPTHSSVTSTELGYVSGVTSAIQTQLNATEKTANKGAANGYAPLDGAGKVPYANLPSALMTFLGAWDASTNTPTLADGTGTSGDTYRVSVAGTQDLGSGSQTFAVGDFVIYNGSIWQHSPAADGVSSVNGQSGAVSLTTSDIPEGSNLYFTNNRAEDAVGGIVADSSTVHLAYVSHTSLTANVIAGSLTNTQINASAAIAYSKLNLTGSIVNADVNASAAIAYSKLNLSGSVVNADIASGAAIAYSKLNLSSSIVNADINASAAIAYSKLNLSASIVNADVSASAAISLSKLAALASHNRALISDNSGVITESSVTSTELGYLSGVTSSVQTQLNSKLSSVSQDTAPSLGGDLDPNGHSIKNTVRFGASAANSLEQDYLHGVSLTASTTAVLASLTFDTKVYKSLAITYTCRRGNDRRTGTIWVSANNTSGNASDNVQLVHEELDTVDLSLTWDVAMNGDNAEVSYTSSTGTYVANFKVERFKA